MFLVNVTSVFIQFRISVCGVDGKKTDDIKINNSPKQIFVLDKNVTDLFTKFTGCNS